jgi:hypothetical protein
VLSGPISRAQWVRGRYLSLLWLPAACAMTAAIAIGSIDHEALPSAALWGALLAMELAIMLAVTLALACALRDAAPSVLAAACFYLAARTIGALMLISERGPLADEAAGNYSGCFLEGLSWILPRMDLFASAGVLMGEPVQLVAAILQTVTYVGVMLIVASLDLRRNDV